MLQLGTGGGGAATAYALLDLGVREHVLHDQDRARAEALARSYAAWFPDAEIRVATALEQELPRVDGAVNATPLGMAQRPGASFDPALLADGAWVADIVYLPLRTELLLRAEQAGHPVLDGGGMAVGQAAESLRLITGLEPDADRMRAHFLELAAPLNDAAPRPDRSERCA